MISLIIVLIIIRILVCCKPIISSCKITISIFQLFARPPHATKYYHFMGLGYWNDVNSTKNSMSSECGLRKTTAICICYIMYNAAMPWASCQIPKIAGCACTGIAGNIFPATDFKWNCYLAIPACITSRASNMSGSLARGGVRKKIPASPAHAQHAILCIWQEAYAILFLPLPEMWSTNCKVTKQSTFHGIAIVVIWFFAIWAKLK